MSKKENNKILPIDWNLWNNCAISILEIEVFNIYDMNLRKSSFLYMIKKPFTPQRNMYGFKHGYNRNGNLTKFAFRHLHTIEKLGLQMYLD